MSCECSVALPHDAVGWSAVCDCGIFLSSSLTRTFYRFTLIVFLVSCGCQCSVSFPHGTMGWSVVCDCGMHVAIFESIR